MKKIISLLAIMLFSMGLVSASSVDVDLDVGNGAVIIDVENTDAVSHVNAEGGFVGSVNAIEDGTFLDTNVLLESTTGASLGFTGKQKLSGYTANSASMATFAFGSTALMNARWDNSHYVVQLERVDTAKDFLRGSGSSYGLGWRTAVVNASDVEGAFVEATLYGNGQGVFDAGQWFPTATTSYGWGNPDSIAAPDVPGYYTPINTVSATGAGEFTHVTYGSHSASANGFVTGEGTITTVVNFAGSFDGTYYGRSK